MTKKLQAVGSSYCIIIDKAIMELLKITPESELEMTTDGKSLIITLKSMPRRPSRAEMRNKIMLVHAETFRKLAQ